jgi:hypothetical protein
MLQQKSLALGINVTEATRSWLKAWQCKIARSILMSAQLGREGGLTDGLGHTLNKVAKPRPWLGLGIGIGIGIGVGVGVGLVTLTGGGWA